MGLITDNTSCETAIFSAPNPFSDMSVDIFTGATVSQTQTIQLSTVWGDCTYTVSVSPVEVWLTHS